LLRDEKSITEGKKGVLWSIELCPCINEKALKVVEKNYPSKSAFIRYAITRQLVYDQTLDEKTKFLLTENKKLKEEHEAMKWAARKYIRRYHDLKREYEELIEKQKIVVKILNT
jgi:hypothetical protein